jgi:hypothetical protein
MPGCPRRSRPAISLPQHADEHRPKRPVLLAPVASISSSRAITRSMNAFISSGVCGAPGTSPFCRPGWFARSREASGRGAARHGEQSRGHLAVDVASAQSRGLTAAGYDAMSSPVYRVPVHIHSRTLGNLDVTR